VLLRLEQPSIIARSSRLPLFTCVLVSGPCSSGVDSLRERRWQPQSQKESYWGRERKKSKRGRKVRKEKKRQ